MNLEWEQGLCESLRGLARRDGLSLGEERLVIGVHLLEVLGNLLLQRLLWTVRQRGTLTLMISLRTISRSSSLSASSPCVKRVSSCFTHSCSGELGAWHLDVSLVDTGASYVCPARDKAVRTASIRYGLADPHSALWNKVGTLAASAHQVEGVRRGARAPCSTGGCVSYSVELLLRAVLRRGPLTVSCSSVGQHEVAHA